MNTELIENTFEVDGSTRVWISNIRGSVAVHPSQTSQVTIRAVKHLDSGNPDHTRIDIRQEADGSIYADTRFDDYGLFNFLLGLPRPSKVDYQVEVPAGCQVSVRGVSSDAHLEGLEGDFQVQTVSGRITLSRLTGPLHLNSVSGDISGEDLSATSLSVETVSGALTCLRTQVDYLRSSTISGSVQMDLPALEGSYRFNTVSGNVHLYVGAGTRCTARATTLSGEIRTNLPASRRQHSPGFKSVEIQGGGPQVDLFSTSGSLIIETGEPIPAPPSPMEVLERIASGELSVDAALNYL